MQSIQQQQLLYTQPLLISQKPIYHSINVKKSIQKCKKQQIIQQILQLHRQNQKKQCQQALLQNTITDLRKVLELVGNNGDQQINLLHLQRQKLKYKSQSSSSALKASHKHGNHLQTCSLFWSQFL